MLTVEATATNTLLRWILGIGDELPSNDDAQAAAELLARQAHRKLGAGLKDWDVAQAWRDLLLPAIEAPAPRLAWDDVEVIVSDEDPNRVLARHLPSRAEVIATGDSPQDAENKAIRLLMLAVELGPEGIRAATGGAS